MREWVYKATRKLRSHDDTMDLLMKYHFLCRSAYKDERERATLVQEVELGDTIHFYYKGTRRVHEFGSYRVTDGKAHPGRFSEPLAETALVGVLDNPGNAALIELLKRKHDGEEGYEPDPVLGVFTGWVLERIGKAPKFDQQRMLPGSMINLWHYPNPELPRRSAR